MQFHLNLLALTSCQGTKKKSSCYKHSCVLSIMLPSELEFPRCQFWAVLVTDQEKKNDSVSDGEQKKQWLQLNSIVMHYPASKQKLHTNLIETSSFLWLEISLEKRSSCWWRINFVVDWESCVIYQPLSWMYQFWSKSCCCDFSLIRTTRENNIGYGVSITGRQIICENHSFFIFYFFPINWIKLNKLNCILEISQLDLVQNRTKKTALKNRTDFIGN